MFKRIPGNCSRAFSFIALAAMLLLTVGNTQPVSASDNTSSFYGVFSALGKMFSPTGQTGNETAPNDSSKISKLVPGTCDTAGPIEVESSGGTTATTAYPTLKAAFDAINAGDHSGTITIDVCGDTTETATAVLNASGAGSASYATITIAPAGGAPRIISGAAAAGSALVELNGADNVLIDGLNSGGNTLTISNTTVSATSGTSTIRFVGDATNNTITRVNILGSSTMATTTNGGTIFFHTAASGGMGNDNNIISNNNIGPAGSNLPTKAIFSNGSTTSTTTYNSDITITGNNVYDYFNPAAQSNGIYLGGATTDWTISNNRFYQTATRTQTTGAIHSAIQVASSTGNNNHSITGNIIGYSNAMGTGTYNFVGVAAASKFLPIYFSSAGTLAPSSIQGNTITAINISGVVGGTGTTASFIGINIASGIATIGNAAGNTVGSLTNAGAISITNNNSAASEVYGIYYFPSQPANVSNNAVGGITITNSGAGNVTFYGIRAFTSAAVVNTLQDNTIGSSEAPISNTTSATGSQTVGLYSQTGIANVTENTIRNLTTNTPNVGTGTSASVIGLFIASAAGANVSQNTIHSLTNNNATAAVSVTGIQFAGATTGANVVDRNFVHSLTVNGTGVSILRGINVTAGNTNFQNNMVRLGIDALGGITGSYDIIGINDASGTNNYYHNSVFIGGTSGVSNLFTFAFNSSVTANTRNIVNNIFANNRAISGGSGGNFAAQYSGTLPNPAGLNSNFNVYQSNDPAALIRSGGTAYNLAGWRAASGNQDSNSLQATLTQINFVNPTGNENDVNLHVQSPTIIEGAGILIPAVTDDFDGQVRADFTPVDIGADAGNFTPIDLSAPAIFFNAFSNTALTNNRTLTVTITDATGVAGGMFSPRIYFRKNGGAYFSTQCVMTGGTAQNGTYDCTIDYSLVGGIMPGDVIDYFVVAQDTLGNVGSAPGGVVASNVNTIMTPPATPLTFNVVAPFPSTVTVGTGGDFTSLTNTGGLFAALNAGILTSNVTAEIISDLTGETGSVALSQLVEQGAGAGTYTVTIKPSGAPRLIQGTTSAAALIRILGADRVTIDGSLAGGTDRSLTIEGQNTAAGTGTIFIGSLGPGAGAVNNTIRNTVIRAGSIGTTANFTFGIFVGNSTGTANGADNDNLTIRNNHIQRARTGMQILGDAAGLNDNLQIIDNIIGDDTAALSIGRQGMNVGLAMNAVIMGNTVKNISLGVADTASPFGILVQSMTTATISQNTITNITNTGNVSTFGFVAQTASTGLNITRNNINTIAGSGTTGANVFGAVLGAGVVNSNFTRNNISNIRYTGTSGFGGKGLDINTGVAASNLTIANNFISDIRGDAWSAAFLSDTVIGLRIAGATGGVKLYYNSVNLGHGEFAGSNQPTVTAAFFVGTGVTDLDVRNNIFVNNLDNTTVMTDKNYAFYSQVANTAFTTINYNDYFVPESTATGPQVLGFLGMDLLTLAEIQTATGQDANSKSVNPLFVSATDLHLQAGSTLRGMATPIAGITNDFDGDTRHPSTPDIGADEFQSFALPTVQFSSATYSSAEGTTATITVTRTGDTTVASAVNYATTNGTATGGASCTTGVDYITASGTLNFAAGETTKTFTVQLCSDAVVKGDETVNITLSSPTGATLGTPSTAVLTITNVAQSNGQLQLSSSTYSVNEGAGNVTVTVTRTNGSEGAVTVDYVTSNGTATGGASCIAGIDYVTTSGTLTFAAGETMKTFMVPICNDTVFEGNETFNVTISNPSGGATLGTPATAIVTIIDDDTQQSVQFVSLTFTGREGTQAVITVTRTGGSTGTVTVNFATANGSATGGASCSTPRVDYISTAGLLTFNPGETTQSFSVQLCSDAAFKPGETINLGLSNPSGNAVLGSPASAVLTLIDKASILNDFDGDGKTDHVVFRPSQNVWYIRESSTGELRFEVFGLETDSFVPADYDGDGRTDVAIFRPSSGIWYIILSGSNSLRNEFWGGSGDIAVPADYDGDGKADVAVFRPSNGTWYIKRSSNGVASVQTFGQSGDRPLVGDFDGDGKADLSVIRADAQPSSPVTVYRLNSADNSFTAINWGIRSDTFVIEDYDGDGKDDLAVYREGIWYVLKSSDNSLLVEYWGNATDIPVAGDFDGDGRADFTVWRESTGTYYTKGSAGENIYLQWGTSGDRPLTNNVRF